MPGLPDINKELAQIRELEKELNLKQLQINGLLGITQAINSNVKAPQIYEMYRSFLATEIGVRKMALYFQDNNKWNCKCYLGISKEKAAQEISGDLLRFKRIHNVHGSEDPFLQEFDVVIPVRHKDMPLAYAFIGGFEEEEDMYNKVQFITTITNIIAVAIENKRLFKRQLEQERFNREMELARQMQELLVPSDLPSNENYELNSIYKPHMVVGGDYYDFVEWKNERMVFCIGDITGKGVAAAILMSNFQAVFQTLITECTELDEFVQSLNRALFRITKGEKFITFFIGMYDLRHQRLFYVNCGHNPPALAMNGEIHRLDKGSTILGVFPELPSVEVGELYISNEALILTYTDGLIDIRNEEGEFMDEEYGYDFVLKNYSLSAANFNAKLLDEIQRFMGPDGFSDDFTVLTCKIY